MTELNLLVISDIHAFDGDPLDDKTVSHFSTRPSSHVTVNPFLAIPDILSSKNLRTDWVVCPGDLADRADPSAQLGTWLALEELRDKIGAIRLIGTVGNHDMDSRLAFDEFDTKSALQSLKPSFPGLSPSDCDFFWSRNFAVLEEENVLLLILNSSAFHGVNSDKRRWPSKEYEHGRVSDRTIAAIQEVVRGRRKPLQILLTHHHIYRSDKILKKDYSEMKNGTKLLEMLNSETEGHWVVIHGHMHYPKIEYGLGDSSSEVVPFV